MARTKEFDREAALDAAVEVFWASGYEGASTGSLLRAMGIGRQSMYDTFGDKRRLYLEALRRYNARSVAGFAHALGGPSPLASLEKAMLEFASAPADRLAMGCMGVNAVCEFGRSDPQVAALTDASAAVLAAALERVVRDAGAAGEVPAGLDEKAAADFVAATLSGMKVSARAGATRETLRGIARLAVQALRTG